MRTYHKYSGAGNSFYIFDDRKGGFPLSIIPQLCHPENGDFTDGVILWRQSKSCDAQMAYFNADGSPGAMCGNGLRCFVHFLYDRGIVKATYSIEVSKKILQVKGNPPTIWSHLGRPRVLLWKRTVQNHTLYVVDTGVPHAVIFVHDPLVPDTKNFMKNFGGQALDVVQTGMSLRNAREFQPQGVNVNFVLVESEDRLRVRTYERGVERETLACGTGAAASVFVANSLGKVGSETEVVTKSEEILKVKLSEGGIALCGPSQKIEEGQL